MPDGKNAAGYALFFLLVIIAAAAAAFAFSNTGTQGIEERFIHAVGLSGDEETMGNIVDATGIPEGTGTVDHDEEGGFSLEGSGVLYILVLVLLAAGCLLAYRKFRI